MEKGAKNSRKKFYTVLDVKGHRQGFFPRTEDGMELAEKFVKKLAKTNKIKKDFYVVK